MTKSDRIRELEREVKRLERKVDDFYTHLMGEWGRALPNGKVARRAGSFELAESYRREQLELRIEQIQEDSRCYR